MVEDVARRLRTEGLKPFLDRWYLAPGARWRTNLEDTLNSSKAIAVFVGPGEMGSWQQREVDVALDLQSRSPNLPVIPVLLPGSEPPLGFLRQLTWVDLRTQTLEFGTAILAKAARGEPPGPNLKEHLDFIRASICPYRGLFHFREEDAPFFFGREASVDRLMDEVQRQPFVAVVGASGSGKSSVVRAGLIPRLRQTKAGRVWEIATLVPTDRPLHSLAAVLVPILEPEMTRIDRLAEINKLAGHFAEGTVALRDVAADVLRAQPGTDRLLLFVDQWEELYTLAADDSGRRRFLVEILDASAKGTVTVVFTLRGDFFGQAISDRSFADRLQDAQINLGPMTREELERAISKPAEKIQLEFEPGLIRRILNDVGDEPGNLPLLEFALEELWKNRRARVLLNETYDGMGELKGALAKKAGEFFKRLSPVDRKVLQRVFLRIVRPSESGEDTRRRAAFSELPPEGKELVGKLTDERLLVTNQSASGLEQTVEVAHEALISNWSTLRAWINEDREFLLWRHRLSTLLKEWELAKESEEALLRGPLLIEAQKWFDQRSQDLSDQERKFISASREERDRFAREEKERRERELKAARELARAEAARAEEAEKRAKEQKEFANKLRRRAFVAIGAAVIALILLAVSFLMWRAAQDQALIADSERRAVALLVDASSMGVSSGAERAKPNVPSYVRDGYYVEDRRVIWDLGHWRDVSPSEKEKVSLAICYGHFTIHREKEEAKNFVHRLSSTAYVEPEVFGNRTFEMLPVEGFDKEGGLRIWEIRFDISNEPLHQPIQVRYVIFFWNIFSTKAQWDAGTRFYNSRTDHSSLEVRFPWRKPAKKVEFETRPPGGEKAKATPYTPDPDLVHYQRDAEGNILSVVWQLEAPAEDRTYWITWDWP
jgi:hypothetical protein